MAKSEFRYVNRALNIQPRIGPFPATQLVPLLVIVIAAYFAHGFGLSLLNTALFAAWLMGGCWIISGDRPWQFLAKFWTPPDVVRGFVRYESLISNETENWYEDN